MAEATLRAYLKEIDDLIEREQLDEAIAHCRHILQVYPKHLDTYRLLGKAYLEAKRFGDAADIFQRVLSAEPDDFVAHVGMSIIREDEGNTDAAIWHMERAFETTPANPAIQQELRRLIGRRDGIEPHKVRLTRGALARMYAHGELYPQAVAELRAALGEDPDRADLQVVLAEMYWRTGQRPEAVEIANKIIEKLPYCREANRILAAASQSSGRTDEAANHHRRLATLDPYAAFVETPMADPQSIDAGSVRLERLEWVPGQAMPLGQPEWASSLSADLRAEAKPQPVSGPVPSWLDETAAPEREIVEPEAPHPTPVPQPATPPAPAAVPPSGEIPPWMRQAGWRESTGAAVEAPVSFSEDEISALEAGGAPPAEAGDLAPGQIPDWLQAVAPKQVTGEEALPQAWGDALMAGAGVGAEAPPWLGEAEAAIEPETAAPAGWEPPAELAPSPAEAAETPEPQPWSQPEAEAEGMPEAEADLEGAPLPSWLEEPSPGATDTIITWLGDRAARDTAEMAMPEWMREDAIPEAPPKPPEEEPVAPSFGVEQPMEEAPAAAGEPPSGPLPGWLAGVAGAAAQQEPLQPEELAHLRGRGEAAPSEEVEEPWAAPPEAAEAPRGAREAPDWLRGIIEPEAAAEAEQPAEATSGPSWLEGTEVPRARAFAPAPEPDWLLGLGEPETPTPEAPQEVPEAPGWLKAIQQGRETEPRAEAEAPSWPQEAGEPVGAAAREEPEDWLREVGEDAGAAAPPPEVPAEEAALAQAELPDWLSGMAPPQAPREAEMPSEEEFGGALPWLEAPAEEAVPEVVEEPVAEEIPQPAAAAVGGEDDVLEWLEGLAAQQATGAAAVAEEAEAEAGEEALVEERLLPEEPAEGLEWLERLAASRGIETEKEQAPALEAVEPEEAPEWLRRTTEEPAIAEKPAEAAAETSLDWLRAVEEEAVGAEPTLEAPVAEEPAFAEEPQVPDWLQDTARVPTPREEVALPAAMEEALPASREELEEAFPAEAEVPDWLRPSAEPPTTPVAAEAVAPGPMEEAAWMEPGEEGAAAVPEEIEAAVPDWLRVPSGPPPVAPPLPPEAPSVWEPIPVPTTPEPVLQAAPPAPAGPEAGFAPPAVEEPAPAPAAPPLAPPAAPLEAGWPAPPATPVEPTPPPAAPEPVVAAPAEVPAAPPAPITPAVAPPAAPAVEAPAPTPAPAAAPPTEPAYVPPSPPAPAPVAPPPVYTPPPAAAPPTYAPPPAAAPPTYPPPPAAQPPPPAATPPYAPPAAYPPPGWPAYAPAQPPYAPAQPVYPPQPTPPPYWPQAAPAPAYAQPPSAPPVPYPPAYAPAPQPVPTPSPPIPAATPAAPGAKPKAGGPSPEEILDRARGAMSSGDIDGALYHYASLIKKKRQLPAVIQDLQSAVERGSMPPSVWQALGDAYMKADRLPEAIESYRHGLEAV